MSDDAMTLHQKLLEVQKTVNYLQAAKEGHQYKYVGSSDVLAPIRNAMDEQGLLLFAEITSHATEGGKQRFTELGVRFTWVNADNATEREAFDWYGQGLDTGEKGVGKALTYAEKYFLLKFFHIATDKDDPDRFQQQHEEPAPAPQPAPPPGEWLDDGRPADLAALAAALMRDGMTEKRVVPYAIRAGKSLGLEDTPPDWTGDQIADVYYEAKRMYEAEQKDAQEAAV
jgi:hypothetical protein